jgi:hypothetical protein
VAMHSVSRDAGIEALCFYLPQVLPAPQSGVGVATSSRGLLSEAISSVVKTSVEVPPWANLKTANAGGTQLWANNVGEGNGKPPQLLFPSYGSVLLWISIIMWILTT